MAQDVFGKMAEDQWILNEDGYLNVDTDVKEIIYHPSLNVILICTTSGLVKVLDVNSGVILQSSSLSAQNLNEIKCKYIPTVDRVLFSDGQALGVRSDYNGVLLLDSILQKTIQDSKDEVKIELPLSEAIILKQSLLNGNQTVIVKQGLHTSNPSGVEQIITQLTETISNAQKLPKKGIKAQKWNTVCLTVSLDELRNAAASTVSALLAKNQHIPELGVASAVQERLADLAGEPVDPADKRSMASEARRRETYRHWPHMDYKWALPDQMAQAGFYHQPNSSGHDRAMCFTCTVCLVCWERTDEPWSEHERHSPNCPFVVGEYTQNVPLSVTLATNPAIDATYRGLNIKIIGNSSVPNLIPTANADGLISVFDVAGKLTRQFSFYVTQYDSHILDKFTQDFGQPGIWQAGENKKHPVEKKITSLCIVCDKEKTPSTTSTSSSANAATTAATAAAKPARSTIICGLNLVTSLTKQKPSSDQSDNDSEVAKSQLYLVVYDFLYSKEQEEAENEINFETNLAYQPEEKDGLGSEEEKMNTTFMDFPNLENLEKDDEIPCYNLMKQLSSFYKTLIPGESDEVFLPPSVTIKKSMTGSKVLMFEDFSSSGGGAKTDSSGTHALTNGQLSSLEGSELSISDHITELKNNQSSKKLNYSRAVQCVCLPSECKEIVDLEIMEIFPTRDQKHVVVVVRSAFGTKSFLLLYALDCTSDKMVKLRENPVAVKELEIDQKPIEVKPLPNVEKFDVKSERLTDAEGCAVMVCVDGAVRVVDLCTLNTVCYAKIDDDAFVSATYCQSLDRLCASTKNGSLHFFALNNPDNEDSDEHEEDDLFGMNVDTSAPVAHQLDSLDPRLVKCFYVEPDVIQLDDLKKLRQLCEFEPLKTGYNVVVPPCWSEFQQALRQRRQPQALKTDGEQHTKTWRLQTDTTTWDEHIFEITLPTPTFLGHVDVHFTLQPSSTLPQVEVTLLRQNKSGIGHNKDVKFAVDETVMIDMLQWVDNPVVSQEYLRAHNADILAGPVNLASHLDLTEQSGVITLTGPKLFKGKLRNLLLHIRAVNTAKEEKNAPNNSAGSGKFKKFEKTSGTTTTTAGSVIEKLGLSGGQQQRKTDFYMGCDAIHELSVTLHGLKQSEVQGDRALRSLMLESNVFVRSLLLTAVSSSGTETLGIILDILDWVAAIRLSRNRSDYGCPPNQQYEFVNVMDKELMNLLHHCLIQGGRSIAHKCMRLVVTCLNGADSVNAACGERFQSSVLQSLFTILDSISEIRSAASLQWLFTLLLKCTTKDREQSIATKCVSILRDISTELVKRQNPYHLLLRSRYGLYGTPMEPELFDIEAPPYVKSESSSTGMFSSWGNASGNGDATSPNGDNASSYPFSKESISPKDVLSTSATKLKYKNIASLRLIHGLIETEPLHFTCTSASEGTRVERADSSSGGGGGGVGSTGASSMCPMAAASQVTTGVGAMPNVHAPAASAGLTNTTNAGAGSYVTAVLGQYGLSGAGADHAGGGPIVTGSVTAPADKKEELQTLLQNFIEKQDAAAAVHAKIITDDNQQPPDGGGGVGGGGGGGGSGGSSAGKNKVDTDWWIMDVLNDADKTIYKINALYQNISKALKSNTPVAGYSSDPQQMQPEIIVPTVNQSNSLPWQQLLAVPPKQVIVVERMHSGARRQVTLDFGKPVLLTDIFIPSCSDLVTLTLDIWLKGEDVDQTRLVVAMDIGTRNLLLTDLQPPPLCRYLKITVVGRYGMSTIRCRIPLGYFYGHIVVLPEEVPQELAEEAAYIACPDLEKQLCVLGKLSEDISCRYSLACSKLKELLHPFLVADMKNATHLATYMNILKDKSTNVNNAEHTKIITAYQETVRYQHQLNIVRNVMARIEGSLYGSSQLTQCSTSTDKLTTIAEGLLEVLLSLDVTTDMQLEACQHFFRALCISQPFRLQLLAAIFLEKSCGQSKFWGDFLADTLTETFSTSCTAKFPQDRLFVLLSYLSRKSSERSAVIDAALRVVHDTLAALRGGKRTLLAVTVDLPLLSWQLMYLSLQLQSAGKGATAPNAGRWNWVFGEMVGKANLDNMKGGNRKKPYKRIFPSGANATYILPSYSSVVINSQNAFHQQQSKLISSSGGSSASGLKCEKLNKLKNFKKSYESAAAAARSKDCSKDSSKDSRSSTLKIPQRADQTHCLVVAKGLLELVLAMDHSSSADLMLLCFKVIAKLVTLAKLHMGQLLKENQLLDLINFCISCKIPWAPFALACFLQDVLDLGSNKSEETEMDTENPTSISWSQNDASETDSIANSFNIDEVMSIGAALIKPPKANSIVNNNSFPPLPSVYESEDSDFDDFLADIRADKFRCSLSKTSRTGAAGAAGAAGAGNSNLSCAMDSRLELGVQAASEVTLKKLVVKHTKELLQNVTAEQSQAETTTQLNPWPTPVEVMPDESSLSNHKILTYCFASLFENLQNQEPSKIEHVLQLWLTLNCPASGNGNSSSAREHFAPGCIPQIVLNCSSVNYLISAFAWTPGLSITTWCLALQTLTLVCNVTNGKKWFDLSGMANTIVNHPDFVQMLLNLLSGTGPVFNGKVLAGPSLCKALHDFLVRLQMRCDIVSSSSKLGNLLKTLLLKVIYQLAQPSGSIASMLGPLDAQCKLLQTMSYLDFTNTDLSIAMSTLESTASLVHNYVLNREKVKCISIGEKQTMSSNAFSEIFASVLGSDSNKQDRPVSYEDLLILMLKLMGKLVHTPLPDQTDAMETESSPPVTSQTDESKAAEQQQQQQQQENSSAPPPTRQQPCFADVVLQHRPTVVRLCRCLAACKSSSLCMLANVSQKVAFSNLSEPNTVADAVFHLLALLARKASRKELLLEPLLAFLSQTPQLSEPLMWFVQQVVLDSEETVRKFFDAGGVTILSNSVISSSSSPSTLPRTGTIAAVMQHFSGGGGAVGGGGPGVGAAGEATSGGGGYAPSGGTEGGTGGTGSGVAGGGGAFACQAPAASKKMMQASIEQKMALVNFAPYCTITCESNTAQPADVLIQGLVTHRRARTPLWSYHFYPEEVHTELILQLPSAILLREVQLQPHAGGLATCPSYVALEVSANGPSRLVPACLPLPTSGLTYIRMHLPVPKVVNCVLIRLYRPHDANGIGLLQIRLLGNYAFGGSLTQNADTDDEAHCKHSLGWLRLLHHCFTAVTDTELRREIIDAASSVPQLLTTCCGLLLVPSHILPVYLPCLEKVLRELALHSPENGFQTIKVLLDSRPGVMEPLVAFDGNWQDRLVNVTGYQSACELLYQICEHQDANTYQRVKMILDWLETSAAKALETGNTDDSNAAYVSTIASILWSAKEANVQYDLKALVTTELFESVYSLKVKAEKNMSLKYALDSLLCAMCYIRPELFSLLLQKVGVLVANFSTDHEASISDDRKDSEGMTDDSKGGVFEMNSEWYGHLSIGDLATLNLTREQLETIALVSRSPTAIKQLLDSGLPKLLNSAIFEFCRSEHGISTVPMAKLENVTSILQFFSDVCDEKTMRDWLGSEEGSSFWLHLLQWLCKKPAMKTLHLQTEAHVQLEEVCVKFLSKCCLCHPTNQARLAKVLCDVIYLQANGNGISGFMRRLILQLLLENEKIPVSVEADETLYKNSKLSHAYVPAHPSFKQTYNRAMLYLNTNTTLLEILDQHVFFRTSYKSDSLLSKKSAAAKKDVFKNWFYEDSDLSMAAGVTAKDKRAKDAKNQSSQAAAAAATAAGVGTTTTATTNSATTPQSKKKRYAPETTGSGAANAGAAGAVSADVEGMRVKCDAYSPDQPLPLTINLGQLLRLIESKGTTTNWPYVHIKIYNSKMSDDKTTEVNSALLQQQPVCSALQVFSSMGGLALLAQHLPTIYSEAVKTTGVEKAAPDQSDSEWIKVEECDDIYEDISEEVVGGGSTSPSKTSGLVSHVPPHSLTAFGLFLRLPGYAEVLLKDMKKALCLLRLVLGVTDDGEGGDIFHSPLADSLPTLPFEVLKRLYDATPLSTDDGRLLRRISVNVGVVHLLLACLGVFTHHQANSATGGAGGGQGGGAQPGDKDGKGAGGKEDKSQLYWAKGTGFGTGSTQQSWNVEQALLKQRNEEEHVTVLLQVLASYINPNDEADEDLNGDVLPPNFHELLAQSALLPAISSYLRNDSVLDMARHIPLYKAVLQLLRALAVSSQLVSLLLPQKGSNEPSVTLLLRNMKSCVDTYASKLRLNTKTKVKSKLGEQLEELEQGEGLATLMPDIQNTANLVSKVTSGMVESDTTFDNSNLIDKKTVTSMEEYYIKVMKNLQFSSYEMITELPEGTIKFVISHHFESNVLTTGEQSHPARVKRIAQEAVTLSTSLPLSYSSSVFVRYDTSRLDVMKVLITGPADTPYANGCFELDVFFPADYPLSPMLINLETTGRHTVRFNPNLYNDGKVCLSVLNTWHGRPEEKWNAQTSSFLQVLVSIQSLILVPEPYFNEPGYERARGTPAGTVSSRDYNLNVCQATVRWAMLEQILNPCPCFKEVIHTHFYLKRHEVIAQVGAWVEELEQEVAKEKKSTRSTKKSPTTTLENFKKVYQQLKDALLKLKPPAFLEQEDEDEEASTPTNNMEVTMTEVHQSEKDKDLEKMVNEMCD